VDPDVAEWQAGQRRGMIATAASVSAAQQPGLSSISTLRRVCSRVLRSPANVATISVRDVAGPCSSQPIWFGDPVDLG